MRLWVLSKSVFAWTVSTFLILLLALSTIPALAAHNPQTGIIVTDDKEFPPFAFLDAQGNPRGITIDIWTLWSKKTGIPVKFHLMEWDEALKAVREGGADAVGGLFLTPERKAYFDYTKEIIRIPSAIFFHGQIAGIKSLKDLSGFQVGVIRGDSSEELLRTKHPDINLLVYTSTDELVKAAIAGQVRVFVADEPVALFYLSKYPGGETFRHSSREIAINRQYSAVRKGNTLLLTTVQSGFDKISETEINNIVTEWSGKSTRADIPWREIGLILIVILIIVPAVLVWNIQLRRRVLRATLNLEERNKELELSRKAIRLSEERYRDLVEHANSVILRMDKEGQILFLNEFALRFFGFRNEEVIGRNVIGTIVPEQETTGRDLATMIKDIAVNPDIYANNENENMRSNGERVWIVWTNKPVYNSNGEVSEILCIGNDVTERKRAEEALRQSEERFSKAFKSSPAPLVISEIETGRFIDVNEAWVRMMGYTRQEQIGYTSREVGIWMNPADRDRIMQKLRSQGSFKEEPIDFRTKAGRNVKALWSAETITLGTQHVMLSMLYDETERKQAEDTLRRSEARMHSVIEG
ncbi:MAG: transporter substrate-binding domain-containing protein, partial [Syntrophales bacterium]|nr:transporter substrate-binding domain-containing protein [Syntrophales bacterium]